jgi:FtsZ-binding cell division protein ZapB
MTSANVSTLITVVVSALAVLAVVASGIAFLKTNIGEKTIALQKEEIAALEQRNRTLTNDVLELKGQVSTLIVENRSLRDLVTQEKAIAALMKTLNDHHSASEKTWDSIARMIQEKK